MQKTKPAMLVYTYLIFKEGNITKNEVYAVDVDTAYFAVKHHEKCEERDIQGLEIKHTAEPDLWEFEKEL